MKARILRTAALAIVGTLAITGAASAQVTKSAAGYLFRMKFVKGAKYSFNMSVGNNAPGMPAATRNMNIPMSMSIVSAEGHSGTVRVDSTNPMSGKPSSTVIKMDDHGKPVGGNMPMQMNISQAMPDKPLKIGQSYSATNSMNSPLGGGQTTVITKVTFVGIRNEGGREVAVMNIASHASGGMTISSTGTQSIATSDGWPVSMKMVSQLSMGSRTTQPMSMVVTMKRQ